MSAHIPSPLGRACAPAGSELLATIARIVWQGDEGEAVIANAADGTKCVIEGAAGQINEGDKVRLLGRYFEDPKYGRQFKASTFLPHVAHDCSGVVKYLSENCDGIGQTIAGRIYDAYLSGAVKKLREDPTAVADDLKLDHMVMHHASEKLCELEKHEAVTIDLHSMFLGRGLGQKAINECIRRWGIRAAEHVRRNPFHLLLAKVPGAGFARTDKLYLDLGGNASALKRQALAGWNAIREANTGNTWHPRSMFDGGVIEQVGRDKANTLGALALARRAKLVVTKDGAALAAHLADPRQAANEANLAASVRSLFNGELAIWRPVGVPTVSQHQADALAAVIEEPFFLLTGTPGTGKTRTLAKLLQAAAMSFGQNHIAVCAPFGKAGVRITQALHAAGLHIEATTIHRLLHVGRNGHDGQGWGFEFNADNPLGYRFIAVDEWSTCDVDLAAALFSALAPGTHVVLVGDPNQLPPVGHGAPLRDMIAAGLPRAHLTEIQRNSGLITAGCTAIREGKLPEFCSWLDIDAGQNLKLFEAGEDVSQLEALRCVVTALAAKPGVNLREDLQILTFLNDKGRVSRKPLNAYLQLLMNPPLENDTQPKNDAFRLRDKVICLSNTFTEAQVFTPSMPVHLTHSWTARRGGSVGDAKVFIANGDMGYVVAVSTTKAEVIVKFRDPDRYVRWRLAGKKAADDKSLGGGKEDLAHAYAITVHKSQGSEWPYIIVMADDGADRVASREGWYTAISRASKWCIVIGKASTVGRQVRRAELPTRKTFLKELWLEDDGDSFVSNDDSVVSGVVVSCGKEGENGEEE